MKCLQCGSERVVKDVRVVDHGHNYGMKFDLTLEAYRDSNAWVFKGAEAFPLQANVCAACGFVMLSVSPQDAQRIEQLRA